MTCSPAAFYPAAPILVLIFLFTVYHILHHRCNPEIIRYAIRRSANAIRGGILYAGTVCLLYYSDFHSVSAWKDQMAGIQFFCGWKPSSWTAFFCAVGNFYRNLFLSLTGPPDKADRGLDAQKLISFSAELLCSSSFCLHFSSLSAGIHAAFVRAACYLCVSRLSRPIFRSYGSGFFSQTPLSKISSILSGTCCHSTRVSYPFFRCRFYHKQRYGNLFYNFLQSLRNPSASPPHKRTAGHPNGKRAAVKSFYLHSSPSWDFIISLLSCYISFYYFVVLFYPLVVLFYHFIFLSLCISFLS